MSRRIAALLGAAALAAAPAAAQDVPEIAYEEFTLDNGLHFIVHEDHSVPIVTVDVWYDVGSGYEAEGRSGFAHLFEHMLFQETENLEQGRMMELIPENGGTFNGSTNTDRTNYFETLPSNRLNLAMWMEAERMARLVVNDENFQREREVVKEERRMRIENQPYADAIGITLDTLAQDYAPYKHSVIGTMDDLNAATVEDVREFHRQYYNPNNAAIVVAGDVTVDQVRELAEEYFAGIPAGPEVTPMPDATPTPRTDGERRVTVEDELANTPAVAMAFNVPPHRHGDTQALTLLNAILSQGESSRMYRRIVDEEEAALAVQAALDTRLGPGRMLVFGLPNQGVEPERIEQLILEEIEKVRAEGVTAEELQKAKNQAVAGQIMGRQTVMSKAEQLQHYRYLHGDVAEINRDVQKMLAVTAEDILRVANTYLTEANRTVVTVVPAPEPAT
ncbi:MAG TPA: pitrilysin family protein [Longimicrobiales bacterium]|nr:pitrilysin family protein [Longimicrobiales bacterium]